MSSFRWRLVITSDLHAISIWKLSQVKQSTLLRDSEKWKFVSMKQIVHIYGNTSRRLNNMFNELSVCYRLDREPVLLFNCINDGNLFSSRVSCSSRCRHGQRPNKQISKWLSHQYDDRGRAICEPVATVLWTNDFVGVLIDTTGEWDELNRPLTGSATVQVRAIGDA